MLSLEIRIRIFDRKHGKGVCDPLFHGFCCKHRSTHTMYAANAARRYRQTPATLLPSLAQPWQKTGTLFAALWPFTVGKTARANLLHYRDGPRDALWRLL